MASTVRRPPMSTLILSQPIQVSPFSPFEPKAISADEFQLNRPVVLKLNNLYMYGNLCLLKTHRISQTPINVETGQFRNLPSMTKLILDGKTLVTALYSALHETQAAIPLRWGCPRILVLHAGFRHFLGHDLSGEPQGIGRKWRYEFDPFCDLVVSPWHPDDIQANKPCRTEIVDDVVDCLAHCPSERLLSGTIQIFPSFTQ